MRTTREKKERKIWRAIVDCEILFGTIINDRFDMRKEMKNALLEVHQNSIG